MKIKFAVITLLLFAFCGPQTQAEICEEYWYLAEYELEQLEKNNKDLVRSFDLYNDDKLSEGVLYASFQEQIDNLDDQIETFSDLTPNDTNELNHKKILRGLENAKEGLEDMQSYFEDGLGRDIEDRIEAGINYAEGVAEVLIIGVVWDCPTD